EIRTSEQWWRMNKAKSFDEFYSILQMNALPRFNVIYADKENNLFFIDNGMVPKRPAGYDWGGVLPGNKSHTNWTELYETDELPQVKNPDCGYVYNTNNSPFKATCPEESCIASNWDPIMDFRYENNNRAQRFIELIDAKERVNFDDLKAIKF